MEAMTKGLGPLKRTAEAGGCGNGTCRLETWRSHLGLSDPWPDRWLLLLFVDALMGGHNLTV
jgi:hypothetical protein